MISLGNPWDGSPLADIILHHKVGEKMATAVVNVLHGDKNCIEEFTVTTRKKFNEEHQKEIAEISVNKPFVAVGGELEGLSVAYSVQQYLLKKNGYKESDGVVPYNSATKMVEDENQLIKRYHVGNEDHRKMIFNNGNIKEDQINEIIKQLDAQYNAQLKSLK